MYLNKNVFVRKTGQPKMAQNNLRRMRLVRWYDGNIFRWQNNLEIRIIKSNTANTNVEECGWQRRDMMEASYAGMPRSGSIPKVGRAYMLAWQLAPPSSVPRFFILFKFSAGQPWLTAYRTDRQDLLLFDIKEQSLRLVTLPLTLAILFGFVYSILA